MQLKYVLRCTQFLPLLKSFYRSHILLAFQFTFREKNSRFCAHNSMAYKHDEKLSPHKRESREYASLSSFWPGPKAFQTFHEAAATPRESNPRAARKTTSTRSVRCVMRENLRARQPRGTCVLRKFLRRSPTDVAMHLPPFRENPAGQWVDHYRISISKYIQGGAFQSSRASQLLYDF